MNRHQGNRLEHQSQQSNNLLHRFGCPKVSNGYPKNSNRVSAPIADELRSVLALPWYYDRLAKVGRGANRRSGMRND
jgi:hypothetical protein